MFPYWHLYQALGHKLPLATPQAVNDAWAWYACRYENSRVITSKYHAIRVDQLLINLCTQYTVHYRWNIGIRTQQTWTQTSPVSFDVHRQWHRNPCRVFPKSCASFPTHSLQKNLSNATGQRCRTSECVLEHTQPCTILHDLLHVLHGVQRQILNNVKIWYISTAYVATICHLLKTHRNRSCFSSNYLPPDAGFWNHHNQYHNITQSGFQH